VAITMPQYLGKLLKDKDIDASKLRVVVYDEADLALEQTPSSTLNSLFEVGDNENDDMDEEPKREYSRLTYLVGASVTEALGNLAVSSRILPPGKSYIATATRFAPLAAGDQVGGDAVASDFLEFQPKTASLQELKLCLYPGLKHQRASVEDDTGLLALTRLLRKELKDYEKSGSLDRPRVVIFFPSEEEAKAAMAPLRDALWGEHRLCVLLPKIGFNPVTILDQFRRNETTVMLATPNSVRGLDVRGLTHVYTLYLPLEDPREYVHLAGRVGRVGQAPPTTSSSGGGGGNVISILRKKEAHKMDELAKQLGFEFTDIDMEKVRSPSYSKDYGDANTADGDNETGEDLESMRRNLEDTMNLLRLADDAAVVDVEASSVSICTDDDDDDDDDEDDDDVEEDSFV
jgi:superfamily II DNA/RNA helicase